MVARKALALAVLALTCAAAFGGCSDAADDIDQYSDCIDICGRFQDCFDEDYDTDSCADRCEDMEHRNGTSNVDECEECLDDQSCSGAVFNCTADCVSVVP
jgi:hypothetical protein